MAPQVRKDLRRKLVAIAGSQAGYFSAGQALGAGYSYPAQHYHAVHHNWLRVGRGIFRLPEWPSSAHEDLVRWTLWSRRKGVISHESALAVHGLGDVNPERVHLSVPRGFRAKAEGVVLHRAVVPPAEREDHSGFWVTTPLRSLVDVASGSLDLDQVATAVAEALQRGLVTPRRLRARADAMDPRTALRIERSLATPDSSSGPLSSTVEQAIEARLNQRARADGVEVNRLRRGFVFERIMARLEGAEPGAWVVKGGMALEWRLGKRARGTRDLDLVLRGRAVSVAELRDRLVDLLAEDRGEDRFLFEVGPAQPLDVGFRFSVKTNLAGKEFATVRLDVAARGDELVATERLHLPGAIPALEQFSPPEVEVAATTQHFAEKLHALTRDYGAQLNTRIRDLVDLMLLIELDLVRPAQVLPVVRHVFESRGTHDVPTELPDPPAGWTEDYAEAAQATSLRARGLQEAMSRLRSFWREALSLSLEGNRHRCDRDQNRNDKKSWPPS